ncbi:dynein axonemal intermediate chain 7 [Topomyia yanbarensis]|uniref:dynein axonemal intermediate chain 7 n=1 Tax=Topomyia yanbarensis TaxID=2498891 RepID=UPI00273C6800|nr:dynein axonemal intermediate chain 7 [Topomyia yanbarensis]
MSPKKKMSKKERARLEAEQAEHQRMELERERQRKVEEEKMRKVREKEEAERKQVQEIVANKMRKVQLEESYKYFSSITDEVKHLHGQLKKDREWQQYMRCNGLPNAFDPADLRKYLHIWCDNIRLCNEREQNWLLFTNEQSILTQDGTVANMSRESLKQQQPEIGNVYAAKAKEVLGILEEIDDALHDADITQSMIDDLHEMKTEFRRVLSNYIDELAYKILCNINRDMELTGLLEVTHKYESDVFKTQLYGLRDMPTPQLNPKEKAKEDSKHTDIDFPLLGFHLVLPAAVKCHHSAIRGLWISYDHFSDYCPTYGMPYRQDHRADLRIISRIEWKKRKEILKAVYEEPREKRPDDSEDDERSHQFIDVDKIYTEHADELMKKERTKKGTKALNLFEHDVNMRSHRIIAGVYCIDYLEQPIQNVKIRKKSLLRTVPQPGKLTKKKFYQPYRPPPTPQPGVRRLPEEIEAEIKQMEENLDKLALITLELPETVFWFEPPIVCRWEQMEETLESEPSFSKYLEKHKQMVQASKERKAKASRDRRTKYIEDFNILDIPPHVALSSIVSDFVVPKLPENYTVKIVPQDDKKKSQRMLSGGKKSREKKKKLSKAPSCTAITNIIYETKLPSYMYPPGCGSKILKIWDRKSKQCYPSLPEESDDPGEYDDSDNDGGKPVSSSRKKQYLFSKFMKDLDELIDTKTPKFDFKIEEIVATVGKAEQGRHSILFMRAEERARERERKKPVQKSKFDSDDEAVDYGDILEVGNYVMVDREREYVGKWTTRDIHDVKFNEDKLTIQFRIGRLGAIGFAANRYSNLPYQTWELKPDIKNPGSAIFSLTAAVVSTEITITEAGFRVNSLQGGPTQALQDSIGQVMPLRKMISMLRSAAVDLFPEDDAFNYSEGSCEKNPIMESHLYDCMGLLVATHNFGSSRWNLLSGCRMCVLLMREIVEHRRVPNHSTLLVTPLKATIVDSLEVSPVFNTTPVESMGHYADLYHLAREHSQPSSKLKQENTSPILRDNVVQLLKSVRPLCFS